MHDFAALRANMVASQLRTNDVTDAHVIQAMGQVPRERFVPPAMVPVAYMESCVALGRGRVLADPRALGKLLQLAEIRPSDSVLDVGCATGYATAVLSRIAARVIGLEEDADFSKTAEDNLRAVGAANARVVRGGLAEGLPNQGPFDVILIEGAIERQPDALLAQLADGGRLVCVMRSGAAGHAYIYLKHEGAVGERSAFDAQLPVLPGFAKAREFVF